jgi:serpin B
MRQFLFPVIILVILVAASVISLSTNTQAPIISQKLTRFTQGDSLATSEAEQTIIDANNQFTYNLYGKLSNDPKNSGKNIFFSPFSISSAMAITYEGARGQTADEIRTVLHFPDNNTRLQKGYSGIYAGINREQRGYTLRTANALWAEKTHAFLPEYILTANQYYGADATNLDFIGKPEDSRVTINKWIEDKTENKIRNLLPTGTISSDTRLVITNAVYFFGKWEKPFDKKDTYEQPFYIPSNGSAPEQEISVQMMQRGDHFNYAETDRLKMIELPYNNTNGKKISMLVILPVKNNLPDVEKSLDAATVQTLEKSLTDTKIVVFLPKFRFDTDYKLSNTLGSMGMPAAFTHAADFSGMDGTGGLFIGNVVHKAYVDVNEEGTEAAAASAVHLTQGSHNPPTFYANHPFLFIIQDRENGNILFMGRVMNPNG